jgi:hypothetical protein
MDWRRVAGLGAVCVIVAVPAVVLGLPLAARAFVHAIALTLDVCVWFAMSISEGASVWSLVAVMARAAAGALVTPRASAMLAALVAIGALALYALQRLLGPPQERSE